MQLTLILLLIFGLTVATPVDLTKINEALLRQGTVQRNSALENLIRNLLEDLRQTMINGSDDIPVLDPLEVERLHVDDELLPLPGSHVTIQDLVVTKLSTFVIETLSVNTASIIPLRYRVTFDLQVPVLEVEASNYDLFLTQGGLNIFGNGDAKINIIEPRVHGSLVVGPRVSIGAGLYFTISSSDVNFTLKAFQSQINGLMNDAAMSQFINSFLGHFVPGAVQLYENEITTFLSDTVQDIGNQLLANLDLSDILG